MRWLLLLSIWLYQNCWPNKLKGNGCIFAESCSNHVFRVTKQEGLKAGIKALRVRTRDCQSGYHFVKTENSFLLVTANGVVYPGLLINSALLDDNNQPLELKK